MKYSALASTFPNSRLELALVWQHMIALMGIKVWRGGQQGNWTRTSYGRWKCEPRQEIMSLCN